MARALKVVGAVVAVVGIVATAGALAFPAVAATAGAAATAGGAFGLSAAALSTIGTIATLSGAVIGAATAAFAPKPSFSGEGNPLNFQTNPQSGLPYAIGRTRMSGVRIYAETNSRPGYTKFDDLLWFGVLLSCGGAIQGIEKFTADNELVTFDASGNAIGKYHDYQAQLVHPGGPQASALALTLGGGSAPGWTAAHKLSGVTHAMWCLRYNKEGELYGAGVPEPAWIGKWVKAYDPRKDSTSPGGSGSHRALNEATYEWTRNPALHALTWALGRWQNGKRVLGIGAPIANIRIADFIEAANVADVNGWHCGGVEWSTDSKWTTFKRMLQAGGAEPTMTGAMIGCRVNTPRVAIATIEAGQLIDSLSIATTRSRRDRFNTVIPRYRSEDHDWEVISGSPISVPVYVDQDGGQRTKEIDFPLVQHEVDQAGVDGNKQAGELAAYEIVNSREAGPISFTVGPQFIGVKTGDVVNLNVPDEGLNNQPILIRSRSIDPATLRITFEAETETASKHDFALGRTTTPPPPFGLTPPDLTPPMPDADLWSLTAGSVGDENGNSIPAITIKGSSDYPSADQVIIRARIVNDPLWYTPAALDAGAPVNFVWSPVVGEVSYEAEVAYKSGERVGPWLHLGPVTTPAYRVAGLTADEIADTIIDFNDDNDSNGLIPPAVSNVSVSGQNFTDSTGQAIVTWQYTASSNPAANNNIDGFLVALMVRPSSSNYIYNASDVNQLRWETVTPNRRSVRFAGVAVDQYSTAVVIPFRNVRSSVEADNVVQGAPAQSSSPYRQASAPNYTGLIDGDTASDVVEGSERARVAITSTGYLGTGRLLTESVATDALNAADWVSQGGLITFATNDVFGAVMLTMPFEGNHLTVQFIFDHQITIMDPATDEEPSFGVVLTAKNLSSGTTYRSGMFTVSDVWNTTGASGLKRFPRDSIGIEYIFENLPKQTYQLGYEITTGPRGGLYSRQYRYMRGVDNKAIS